VTLKCGGLQIHRFPDLEAIERQTVLREVRDCLDAYEGTTAGFAFVVWGRDLCNSSTFRNNDHSPLSRMMIPDFCRGQLQLAVVYDCLTR